MPIIVVALVSPIRSRAAICRLRLRSRNRTTGAIKVTRTVRRLRRSRRISIDRNVRLNPPNRGARRVARPTARGSPVAHAAASSDVSARKASSRLWAAISTSSGGGGREQVPGHRIGIHGLDMDTVAADLDLPDTRQRRQARLVGTRQGRADRSTAREVPDLGGRPVGDDAALAEQDDPIRIGIGLLEVVGREEHGSPLLGVATDRGPEVATSLHVHPGGGLVEGHQCWVRQQRQREAETLLFAAGALPDQPIGDRFDAGSFQDLIDRARIGIQRCRQSDRLAHRDVLEQAARLHDRAHEAARDGRGGGHAEHADGPVVRLSEAQDHVDGRRLAGAVGTQQRGDLTELELQVDAVDGSHRTERPMHAAQLDRGWRTLHADHGHDCTPLVRGRPGPDPSPPPGSDECRAACASAVPEPTCWPARQPTVIVAVMLGWMVQ